MTIKINVLRRIILNETPRKIILRSKKIYLLKSQKTFKYGVKGIANTSSVFKQQVIDSPHPGARQFNIIKNILIAQGLNGRLITNDYPSGELTTHKPQNSVLPHLYRFRDNQVPCNLEYRISIRE